MRIGNSSMARTTGRSLTARAANTASPLCGQFPASIPARSFTLMSARANSSNRSPTSCSTFAKPSLIRSQAPCSGLACTPISATASAGSIAASRSTKTVSISPVSASRCNSSRTRLVLPMRRCAVSKVWVPSRTRSSSASNSASRSKNRSPSTQLLPPFVSIANFPTYLLATISLVKICCQERVLFTRESPLLARSPGRTGGCVVTVWRRLPVRPARAHPFSLDGTPVAATRCKAACCSAWAFNADRHANPLTFRCFGGSNADA